MKSSQPESVFSCARSGRPAVAITLILIGVLFIALPCSAQQPPERESVMTLATLDVHALARGFQSDEEMQGFCRVIAEFDFVALQGVRDERMLSAAVERLDDRFDLEYRYLASQNVGVETAEMYAFLWRTDRVEYSGLSGVYLDPKDAFSRDPFFALFETHRFDFYAISVRLSLSDDPATREAEALLLHDVYRFVQDLDGENDVLMAGSFALPTGNSAFDRLRRIPGMTALADDAPASAGDEANVTVWFQSSFTDEYTGDWGVLRLEEKSGDRTMRALSAVLDRRPVWAAFDLSEGDD